MQSIQDCLLCAHRESIRDQNGARAGGIRAVIVGQSNLRCINDPSLLPQLNKSGFVLKVLKILTTQSWYCLNVRLSFTLVSMFTGIENGVTLAVGSFSHAYQPMKDCVESALPGGRGISVCNYEPNLVVQYNWSSSRLSASIICNSPFFDFPFLRCSTLARSGFRA